MSQGIRIADDAALFVLEDQGVFFSESRQELYTFNTPATFVWCCLEDGLGHAEVADAYASTFGLDAAEARRRVADLLNQWQSLGYISGVEVPPASEVDLTTALARLLVNPGLRKEFATAPRETAQRLGVRTPDLEALLALDPAALDRQAEMLATKQAARRRGGVGPGVENVYASVFARGRTELEVAARWRGRDPGRPSVARHYRLLSTTFCVRFTTRAAEARVHPVLSHLEIAEPPTVDTVLDLLAGKGGYVLLEDIVPVGHCARVQELAPLVKLRIRETALNRHRYFLAVHAGVVLAGDRCVLLPGAPGSGKSTLTAALSLAGFTYCSDEFALLEGSPLQLRPVPLSLTVKAGAVAPLTPCYPEVGSLPTHVREDGQLVRYLCPPLPFADCERTYPVGWIVFPRYRPAASSALEPVSRAEALRRLMRESLVLPDLLDRSRVEDLVRWMREVECFELSVRTLTEATELVKGAVGGSGGHRTYDLRIRSPSLCPAEPRAPGPSLAVGRPVRPRPEVVHSSSVHPPLVTQKRLTQVEKRALLEKLMREADPRSAPREISSVGILTRDRPQALQRALASYIENVRRRGRDPEFVVVDDSKREEHTRQALRSLRAQYDIRLSYAGREEKREFARLLADESDVSPDIVNFALFNVEHRRLSTGANRNAMLLHTVGEAFFSADDDTICRIAVPPRHGKEVRFFSGQDPAEYWFYRDRDTAIRSNPPLELDLLAIHEEMLGKDMGSCVKTAGEADFDQADGHFLERLHSGAGRVAVTLNRILGDCGGGGSLWLYTLGGASRERLVESEADYRSARTSREVLAGVPCKTISSGSFCMTTFVGFDNRDLLPPCMPVERAADVVFGAVLRKCLEDSYIAHLPYALLHAPLERRLYPPDDPAKAVSRGAMYQLLTALIPSSDPAATDGRSRLRALGRHLREIGSLELPEFEELVRHKVGWQLESLCLRLRRLRRQYGETPGYWARDLGLILESLEKSIAAGDYVVPASLLVGRTRDDARLLSRRLVFRFGQLLEAWPHLVEAARALRARGRRVACPV